MTFSREQFNQALRDAMISSADFQIKQNIELGQIGKAVNLAMSFFVLSATRNINRYLGFIEKIMGEINAKECEGKLEIQKHLAGFLSGLLESISSLTFNNSNLIQRLHWLVFNQNFLLHALEHWGEAVSPYSGRAESALQEITRIDCERRKEIPQAARGEQVQEDGPQSSPRAHIGWSEYSNPDFTRLTFGQGPKHGSANDLLNKGEWETGSSPGLSPERGSEDTAHCSQSGEGDHIFGVQGDIATAGSSQSLSPYQLLSAPTSRLGALPTPGTSPGHSSVSTAQVVSPLTMPLPPSQISPPAVPLPQSCGGNARGRNIWLTIHEKYISNVKLQLEKNDMKQAVKLAMVSLDVFLRKYGSGGATSYFLRYIKAVVDSSVGREQNFGLQAEKFLQDLVESVRSKGLNDKLVGELDQLRSAQQIEREKEILAAVAKGSVCKGSGLLSPHRGVSVYFPQSPFSVPGASPGYSVGTLTPLTGPQPLPPSQISPPAVPLSQQPYGGYGQRGSGHAGQTFEVFNQGLTFSSYQSDGGSFTSQTPVAPGNR